MAKGANHHVKRRAEGDPEASAARFLQHAGRACAWLLPPVTVYAVFTLFDLVRGRLSLSSSALVIGPVHAVWPPADASAVAGEVVGRLTWGLTASVFLLVWIAAVVICLGVVLRTFLRHRLAVATWLWGGGLVSLVVWAAVGLSARRLPVSIPSLRPLLEVLEQTAPGVEGFAVGLIRMALIVAVGLTFAGAGLLLSTGRAAETGDAEADEADALRSRTQSLHLLLYSGAAVLVAGVLQVGALHHWALAALAPADAEPLVPLVNSLSMVIGTYWTLVLFGFYTPVVLLLRREARGLARRCVRETERGEPETREPESPAAEGSTAETGEPAEPRFQQIRAWLEEQGLASSSKQTLVRVGALLGPFLAGGPLGAVVDLLKT